MVGMGSRMLLSVSACCCWASACMIHTASRLSLMNVLQINCHMMCFGYMMVPRVSACVCWHCWCRSTAAGAGKTSLAKLQLNGHEGHSLSLIAAKCTPRKAAAAADAAEDASSSSSSSAQQGMRFLGVQAPGSSSSSSSGAGSYAAAGTVLGVAGERWDGAV
jgi:hypothetical protein